MDTTSVGDTSPHAAHSIRIKQNFVADQRNVLRQCLRNQHTVERISVCPRQLARANRMVDRNRKRFETFPCKSAFKIGDQLNRAWQLPDPHFRRNFPR